MRVSRLHRVTLTKAPFASAVSQLTDFENDQENPFEFETKSDWGREFPSGGIAVREFRENFFNGSQTLPFPRSPKVVAWVLTATQHILEYADGYYLMVRDLRDQDDVIFATGEQHREALAEMLERCM
jgi:hypothetical protein